MMTGLGVLTTRVGVFEVSNGESGEIWELHRTYPPWAAFGGAFCHVTDEIALEDTELEVLCDCCFFHCRTEGLNVGKFLAEG